MTPIEEIKERLDIVDIISTYVPLRKAGRNYKGLCPFHQEKTPSFVVFPETGTWRCFGACGTGGDIFGFVMKRENLDFREALELLAQKAGVSLAPPGAAQSQQEHYLDRLREINQAAALYFHNLLRQSSEAQPARDYLVRRGLDDATIDAFQMGYALDSWDALMGYLLERNYSLEDLVAAGLIIARERDDGSLSHYDRFRGRILVPIRDVRGRIIGFGGRVLAADQQPKYLNTPQTPLFDKSSVLFGLDVARKSIRARGQAVIVEGYMDVLAAHQFGETNVVASMGTALTEQQLRQLKRYTDTFILALDADTAGQAATLRGISQAREALDREWVATISAKGLLRHESRLAAQLRIMTLPEGQDPDDVIRSDPSLWQKLVEQSQPVVEYFFDLVRRELNLETAQGKSQAAQRLAPLIREVADEIQRSHYTQQLARLIQTDVRTVERLVTASRPASPPRQAVAPPPDPADVWDDTGEIDESWMSDEAPAPATFARPVSQAKKLQSGPATHLLALLVMQPQILPDIQSELIEIGAGPLDEDDFAGADERAICAALLSGAIGEQSSSALPEELSLQAEPALHPLLAQLQAYAQRWPALSHQQAAKDAVDSVLRLRIADLKMRSRQFPALVSEAESEGLEEEVRFYRQRLADLSRHRLLLEQALNARTLSGRRPAAS